MKLPSSNFGFNEVLLCLFEFMAIISITLEDILEFVKMFQLYVGCNKCSFFSPFNKHLLLLVEDNFTVFLYFCFIFKLVLRSKHQRPKLLPKL